MSSCPDSTFSISRWPGWMNLSIYPFSAHILFAGCGRCPQMHQSWPQSQELCQHNCVKGDKWNVTFDSWYYSNCTCNHLVFFCCFFLLFQCPTVYQEEMERDMERSDQEQNNGPTERSLIVLHKKVQMMGKDCRACWWLGCQTWPRFLVFRSSLQFRDTARLTCSGQSC